MTNPNTQVTYIFKHDLVTGKVEIVQTNLIPTSNKLLNNSSTQDVVSMAADAWKAVNENYIMRGKIPFLNSFNK